MQACGHSVLERATIWTGLTKRRATSSQTTVVIM